MFLNSLASLALLAQLSLSLQDATNKALNQNRDVQQAKLAVQARVEDIAVAKAKRWPTLSTSAQIGPVLNHPSIEFTFLQPPMDITVPRRIGGYTLSQAALPLSQQARLGIGVQQARKGADLAQEDAEAMRLSVVAQVRDLYFQTVALEAAKRAARSQVETAVEIVRVAHEALEKGVALPVDVAGAESKLAQARADVENLAADIRNGREQLNVIMGEPLNSEFELSDAAPRAVALTIDEARRQAIATRPELKEARIRLEQSALAVHAKRLESIPDISLSVTYLYFLNTNNYLPDQLATAGLSLTWEPWDWGRKRHEAASLLNEEERQRLAVKQLEEQTAFESDRAFREFERAQRNLAVAQTVTKTAEESLRVTRERQARQAALLRDLLEAQSNWESAGQQEARALAGVGIAWANLQAAIGAN